MVSRNAGSQALRIGAETIVTGDSFSDGRARIAAKNASQIAVTSARLSPWNSVLICRMFFGRKMICSPQCGVQPAAAEIHCQRDQLGEGR